MVVAMNLFQVQMDGRTEVIDMALRTMLLKMVKQDVDFKDAHLVLVNSFWMMLENVLVNLEQDYSPRVELQTQQAVFSVSVVANEVLSIYKKHTAFVFAMFVRLLPVVNKITNRGDLTSLSSSCLVAWSNSRKPISRMHLEDLKVWTNSNIINKIDE
eukprot:CAMPEP_0116960626 /NCGR_PEP_ID=MMETSP0467-20121206/46062_1 /TAXON_ID=283647 /ORGANISM="Mesodinium pulex, Strain SPMC105" /LENGTH=156 /DNA_ID=CAMNT_0004648369 /DNA_START=212 /DNA_END=683 /DNA_ORIENTATION=+